MRRTPFTSPSASRRSRRSYYNLDVDILYDDIRFIIPRPTDRYKISPIIPLFNVNPYEYVYENDNKFFYILIISNEKLSYNYTFNIKKPKLLTDFKYKTINALPNLIDEKDYYKIKIPKGDYNSLLVETIVTSNDIKLTLSKDNIQYPLIHKKNIQLSYYLYQFLISKNNETDLYINYYDNFDYGYINFVENIYTIYSLNTITTCEKYNQIKPKLEITGQNFKIKVNITSYFYYFYPDIIKYYIIINAVDYNSFIGCYSIDFMSFYYIITNKKKINKSNNEFITTIEDKGNNETIEIEFNMDVEPKDYNKIVFVPVKNNSNLIEFNHIMVGYFNYIKEENNKPEETNNWIVIIILVLLLFIIVGFVIFIIFHLLCKKKKSSIEEINQPIMKELN